LDTASRMRSSSKEWEAAADAVVVVVATRQAAAARRGRRAGAILTLLWGNRWRSKNWEAVYHVSAAAAAHAAAIARCDGRLACSVVCVGVVGAAAETRCVARRLGRGGPPASNSRRTGDGRRASIRLAMDVRQMAAYNRRCRRRASCQLCAATRRANQKMVTRIRKARGTTQRLQHGSCCRTNLNLHQRVLVISERRVGGYRYR